MNPQARTYEWFSPYRATVRRMDGSVVSHVNVLARSSIECEELAWEFTRDRLKQAGESTQSLSVETFRLDGPDNIANWLGPKVDETIAERKSVRRVA